jgi:hypothetical protein
LVSLSILKSLATECRHNIALISPALLASLNATLSQVPSDTEVLVRTATVVSEIYGGVKLNQRLNVYFSVHSMDYIYGWTPYWRGPQFDERLFGYLEKLRKTELFRK